MSDTERELPQNYVDFARELCRVAKKHSIDEMHVHFQSGIYNRNMKWPHPVEVDWSQGRHGAEQDRMTLSSTVIIQARTQGMFELENVPRDMRQARIEAAAKALWNTMHARMGGEWPGMDSDLVAVKQCVGTATEMLRVAGEV